MNFLTRWYTNHVNLKFDPSFAERFRKEQVKTELLRINLLAGTMATGAIVGGSIFFLLQEQSVFDLLFSAMGILFLSVSFMLAYELLMRQYVLHCLREGKQILRKYKIANLFVETSFPTLIILYFALRVENLVVFFSPFILLYFLFIILSTLHLDPWLSVLTGVVAAAGYFFISEIIVLLLPEPQGIYVLLASHTLILARMMLILLCGVASGFVAIEIRRRIIVTSKVADQRNRIRQIFGQQVSHEIVDQIIREGKEIQTRKHHLCVMFLDVRNFTPFASTKSPEEVLAFQNHLFGNLIEVVNKNHGIINQILGDGFMATFGAPISQGNDCANAVNAATESLDCVQRLITEGFIPETRIGIGLDYGEAITGNIGTEMRKQYSIVGNVVIQAARIEQLNKKFHTQLLVSRDVFVNLENVVGESLGEVVLKGESAPVEIYCLR